MHFKKYEGYFPVNLKRILLVRKKYSEEHWLSLVPGEGHPKDGPEGPDHGREKGLLWVPAVAWVPVPPAQGPGAFLLHAVLPTLHLLPCPTRHE